MIGIVSLNIILVHYNICDIKNNYHIKLLDTIIL